MRDEAAGVGVVAKGVRGVGGDTLLDQMLRGFELEKISWRNCRGLYEGEKRGKKGRHVSKSSESSSSSTLAAELSLNAAARCALAADRSFFA